MPTSSSSAGKKPKQRTPTPHRHRADKKPSSSGIIKSGKNRPSTAAQNIENRRPNRSPMAAQNNKNRRPSSSAKTAKHRPPAAPSFAENHKTRHPRRELTRPTAKHNFAGNRPPISAQKNNAHRPTTNRHGQQQTSRGGDEKLQKTMAALGLGSRRTGEALIQAGRVSINGKTAHLGARIKASDVITIDGKVLARAGSPARLLCYHKPIGKIVERGASNSVFADLPSLAVGRWVNIGRLDVNSEGLLLFSTDGDLVQRLAHPKHGVIRQYLARVDGTLSAEECEEIRRGVLVDHKPLRPVDFAPRPGTEGRNQWYRLSLTEGRNRAVRRLFAHFNRHVSRLIRLQMGDYSLPRDLYPGQWRELTPPQPPSNDTIHLSRRPIKRRA